MSSSDQAESPDQVIPCGTALSWSESGRLAALDRYAILDTGRDDAFDAIVDLAADILDAPIAVVNFIAADRQWFKAEIGIGADELPLDVSICRHAILQPGIFVVRDLAADPRFAHNPLVDVAGGLRFYAGALLETPDRFRLGTICVLDNEPRPDGISPRQARALATLAGQAMTQLELRRAKALAERQSRNLALIADGAVRLMAAPDAETLVAQLYAALAEPFALNVCFHYRCGDGHLELVASAGLTTKQRALAARLEFGQTVCGIVAATREEAHIAHICASDDGDTAFLRDLGIDSYISLPLFDDGSLLGTLSFGRKTAASSNAELETVRALAAQAATALARLRGDDARNAAEQRFRAVFEQTSLGIARVAFDGEAFLEVNDALCAITGYSRDELVGRSWVSITHPKDVDLELARFGDMAKGEADSYTIETRYIRKDGRPIWVALTLSLVRDRRGGPDFKICVVEDIDARKAETDRRAFLLRLDDALRDATTTQDVLVAASRLLGTQLSTGRVGYGVVDEPRDWVDVASDWHDETMPSAGGRWRIADLATPLFDALDRGLTKVLRDMGTDPLTREVVESPEMRRGAMRASIDVPFLHEGRLRGLLFVNEPMPRDWQPAEVALVEETARRVGATVERIRAEAATLAVQRRLDAVLDNASVAVFLMNDQQHCQYMNRAAEDLTGYTFAETQGRPLHDVIHHSYPDGRPFPLAECAIDRAFPENANTRGEEVFVHKDGRFYPVAFVASPIRDENSKTIGTIIEVRDISADKAAAKALQDSEARYRTLVESATDFAIVMLDGEGVLASWNTGAEAMMGYEEAEAVGQSGAIFFTEEDRTAKAPEREMATAMRDGRATNERWHVRKDGSRFWGSGLMQPIEGTPGFVKIFRDRTTERAQSKAHDDAMAAENASMQLLQEVGTRLVKEDDVETVYAQLLDTAMQLMRSDRASIQMLDDDGSTLTLLASQGFAPQSVAHWQKVAAGCGSSCGLALECQRRIHIADVEAFEPLPDGGEMAAYRASGIRGVQSTPLTSRSGAIVGMFSTHWREPHVPDERAFRYFDLLAHQAADVIDRAISRNALRESEERFRSIAENMSEGVIIFDANGDALFHNAASLRIHGYDDPEHGKFRDLNLRTNGKDVTKAERFGHRTLGRCHECCAENTSRARSFVAGSLPTGVSISPAIMTRRSLMPRAM